MAPPTPLPELRVAERDWRRLRDALDGSFRSEFGEERGALALLGESGSARRPAFLVADTLLPRPGEVRATAGSLIFDSTYLRRAHLRMRERRLAAIATVHTHPFADEEVAFSHLVDDIEDPQLIENLKDIHPCTRLVSIVLGRRSQAGRVWSSSSQTQALSRLVVVGETIRVLPLDGSRSPSPPPVEAIFDRARAVTDAGALRALGNMTIAVVGVSGIGSLLAELLVRAGCRRLLLVDDDIVKLVNLNRILHAGLTDLGAQKVLVVDRGLHESGFELEIAPVVGNVLDREVLMRLRDADLVFGCVDRDWPRDVLAEFAFRYVIPYIDLGTEIGSDKKQTAIMSLDVRVSYVAPWRPCHRCTGVVTARRLRFESLAKEERQREIELGYSDDLRLDEPAVMELNMRAASLGGLLLRHLLQPFLLPPLPVMLLENILTYSMRPIDKARAANPRCSVCRENPYVGLGDCGPPLGYEHELLARVFGNDDR